MVYQDFEESHINRRSNTKKQKKKTIVFKVLQLLTYNSYPEIQKCHCRDKVLQTFDGTKNRQNHILTLFLVTL